MARVLILRAGSGMGNNVIRSLRAGDPSVEIIGCHDDRFVLQKSDADRNYGLPFDPEMLLEALKRIIQQEQIELLIPVNDADVLTISAMRNRLGCRTFLPRHEVIEVCQDKYSLSTLLREHGVPVPVTHEIPGVNAVDAVYARFPNATKLWCRARAGTGSFAAIPVINADQVRAWIAYWRDMRNIREDAFTLSEYLPGRDFYVQSLWKDGSLILTKMAERLAYLDNGSPSGVSSLSSLAKTAFEPDVIDVCTRAVRAVDRQASGVFFIDVKVREDGTPCITEINAGRFTIGTNILDLTGKYNMVVMYVQLALGDAVSFPDAHDYAANQYAVRAIDTTPTIVDHMSLLEYLSVPGNVRTPSQTFRARRAAGHPNGRIAFQRSERGEPRWVRASKRTK